MPRAIGSTHPVATYYIEKPTDFFFLLLLGVSKTGKYLRNCNLLTTYPYKTLKNKIHV
jgi:hypothetical protein